MLPYEHLPHRQPFHMLDKAEMDEENRKAKGLRLITANDPVTCPDGSVPQAYIIEAMAQISGIASGRCGGSLFAGISDLSLHGTAVAGEVLELESSVERSMGSLFMFRAKASVSGKTIAEGGIMLHFDSDNSAD